MMVVHEDSETLVEVPVIRKPFLEQKSYVIVKNHVRELLNTEETTSSIITSREKSPHETENVEKKKRKSDKKVKKNTQVTMTLDESEDQTNITTGIDKNDLEELRTVYMQCKQVIKKIETKYRHLLDLESEAGPSSRRKRKITTEDSTDNECDCKLTKKIVFDDDGKQSTVETVQEKHICVKKVKHTRTEIKTRSKQIAIEYTENEIDLPDNLQDLSTMLHDSDVEKPVRNKIIDKIKMLRQGLVNDIRFNKHAIIEKLKANPDEMLGFKGTNLSTIPGYS